MMHLTFNDLNLHVGMSHPATSLPEVLEWVKNNNFPAEKVTTALVDWDDAPERYAGRTTKLVLHRPPLT